MYKKIAILASLPLLFSGCVTGINEPTTTTSKLSKVLIEKEVVQIQSKYLNKIIYLNKANCGDISSKELSSYKEISAIHSTINEKLEELSSLETYDIKEGIEYKIDYCKLSEQELNLSLDVKLYNKNITISSISEGKTISNDYTPKEYTHKSTLKLLKNQPLNIANFKINWTTITE